MWGGALAHNNLMNTGRVGDWASHNIEHELSGIYDVAHGAGLAVVFPAWMKYVYKHDIKRFCQFATRVWDVEPNFFSPENRTGRISRLEGSSLNQHTCYSVRLKVPLDRLEEMADKATMVINPLGRLCL